MVVRCGRCLVSLSPSREEGEGHKRSLRKFKVEFQKVYKIY
jgi:hypothetical protein